MTTLRLRSGLVLATLLLAAAAPAATPFDIDLDVTNDAPKYMQIEKPTAGRAFVGHVVSYVRIIPKVGKPIYPAFITTHNYLTCPDKKDKKWNVTDVKQVSFDRRSGVEIIGFFFDTPECQNPTFHLEPILADS